MSGLRILPPGAVQMPDHADAVPAPAAPAVPVERRPPPDGYQLAVEAHLQAAPTSRVDPGIAAAVAWHTKAIRELSFRVLPEPDVVPDDAPVAATAVCRTACAGSA